MFRKTTDLKEIIRNLPWRWFPSSPCANSSTNNKHALQRSGRMSSSVIARSIAILTAMTLYLPAVPAYAQCSGASATAPITVDDESSSIAGARMLVNGGGTTVNTSVPSQISITANYPFPLTINSYSGGSTFSPLANTYTSVTSATGINLPATSGVAVGTVIALTIGGAQGSTIVNTASGAGDSIIFNGSTSNSSITINNGDEISLANQGSGTWLVTSFLPQGGSSGSKWTLLQGGTGASTASAARTNLGAAASGANSDITSLTGLTTPLAASQGGTGTTAGAAAKGANSDITSLTGLTTPLAASEGGTGTTLGAAAKGANSDITSLTGLTTAITVAEGGTGATTAAAARTNLSAAASGSNSDITALSALSTALTVAQGGTGATSATTARTNLSAAKSAANSDITSLSGLTTPLSVAQGGTGQSSLTNVVQEDVRLYLSSAAPAADVTNDTSNFYVGPFNGGTVSLPDNTGNNFSVFNLSEISTALPAQVFRLMDVFIYNNSGSVGVSTTYWDSSGQTTGSITAATAANPCVLTAANSLTAGDMIGIAGITGTMGTDSTRGLNGRVFTVASRTSTTITLEAGNDASTLTYTSGGTWYKIPVSRTTGLSFQNGCYLQTGNLQNLYVGTLMVGSEGTSARADDNTSSRLVWNYFQRLPKYMTCVDSTSSWTYAGTTYRPRNRSTSPGVGRMEFLLGLREEPISGSESMLLANSGVSVNYNALSVNHVDGSGTLIAPIKATEFVANTLLGASSANASTIPSLGYSFAQAIEKVGSGTATFSGSSADPSAGTSWLQGRW